LHKAVVILQKKLAKVIGSKVQGTDMTATLGKSSKNTHKSVNLEHFTYQDALCLTIHDVNIRIRVTHSALLEHLINYLPPEYKISSAQAVDSQYSLIVSDYDYNNYLYRNNEKIAHSWEIEDIFEALDSDIRLQIGILVINSLKKFNHDTCCKKL
jgi:outer membrane usher protein FimD/PapC